MYYPWWHMDSNMVNPQIIYYYRRKQRRHHPTWDSSSSSSYLGAASISNNKNELKPDFQAIVSDAFEMNNIKDSDLKKAITNALEQAVDYDQIYKFVQEKMKLDKRNDGAHYSEQAQKVRDVRNSPRPSPSASESPRFEEPPNHEG
ncbi:hypothetical protein JIR001_16710 [Polycladomyces abyssicola]|uniref:Uncharacterized protein n=1 Tax=Polycladomyces abyssicola TaxID=1125966 RepID=A0A8D5ZP16_9BACL|nr:hypothetical protein [Polycladomyces abyssicola]BCU81888.1 hypothetical protein JIR001_16710 [Polycladomyces abyssicola]